MPKLDITCPTCKKNVIWSEANPFRPFCSERCKLIDLGDWAAEKFRIVDQDPDPDPDSENDEHK